MKQAPTGYHENVNNATYQCSSLRNWKSFNLRPIDRIMITVETYGTHRKLRREILGRGAWHVSWWLQLNELGQNHHIKWGHRNKFTSFISMAETRQNVRSFPIIYRQNCRSSYILPSIGCILHQIYFIFTIYTVWMNTSIICTIGFTLRIGGFCDFRKNKRPYRSIIHKNEILACFGINWSTEYRDPGVRPRSLWWAQDHRCLSMVFMTRHLELKQPSCSIWPSDIGSITGLLHNWTREMLRSASKQIHDLSLDIQHWTTACYWAGGGRTRCSCPVHAHVRL
jgi:hypothetical protein